MKLLIAIILLFPGCAAESAPIVRPAPAMELASLPRPIRPVQEAEVPPGPPSLPPAKETAQQVALRYHQIEERLVGAVTKDDVTPGYIHQVQQADIQARHKLAVIEASNGHPSRQSVDEARDAVSHLGDVLAQPPDQADP